MTEKYKDLDVNRKKNKSLGVSQLEMDEISDPELNGPEVFG